MAADDEEAISPPTYARAAKSYIFNFVLFAGFIAYLDEPTLGWQWVPILVGGMFVAVLIFALPVTALKRFAGTRFESRRLKGGGTILDLVIDMAGYVVMWFVARYAIGVLGV